MNKTDKEKALSTGLTLFIIAILVGAVVYQQTPTEDPAPTLSVETESDEISLAEMPELAPVIEAIEEAYAEEIRIVSEPVGIPSFVEAFADARNLLGAGQTFFWNGSEYSTNNAEDLITASPESDSELSESNFAVEDSSGEILTLSENP